MKTLLRWLSLIALSLMLGCESAPPQYVQDVSDNSASLVYPSIGWTFIRQGGSCEDWRLISQMTRRIVKIPSGVRTSVGVIFMPADARYVNRCEPLVLSFTPQSGRTYVATLGIRQINAHLSECSFDLSYKQVDGMPVPLDSEAVEIEGKSLQVCGF